MRIAVPDLISNSYFPAVAAVELGCFAEQGIDASIELIFPVDKAYRALADGSVDLVAGSAHSALSAFPDWAGVQLLAAQAQGMYWFLVMRSDLRPQRGDLSIVKGRKIGAAPWVDLGLKRLLASAGFDLARDGIEIAPVPGTAGAGVNFGLSAARALADGRIDGFWANGMGTEVAVRSGAGTVVLDVRRGDGPAGCFDVTFASIAARRELVSDSPSTAQRIVRALRAAHSALKRDPELATMVGRKVFPAEQADLIADLVRRDLPYYDPVISRRSIDGMSSFARATGLASIDADYEQLVPECVRMVWTE